MATTAAAAAANSAQAGDNISWVALLVVILVVLASIVVGLRIYTRSQILNHLDWDDYCVIFTLAIAIGNGAILLSCIRYGLGRHTTELGLFEVTEYLRSFWLLIVFYNLALGLIKLTFMLQYYRAFAIYRMRKAIWILGSIIMAWSTTQLLTAIFVCIPVRKFWDTTLPGYCIPNFPSWYINAGVNITTDLVITIMPLPVLKSLQLNNDKQRYMLMCIFSLGFFTCAISIIRINYLKIGTDFTYGNVAAACWSIAEIYCGITCACLPTLRPLMAKLKPSWIQKLSNRRNRNNNNNNTKSNYNNESRSVPTNASLHAGNRSGTATARNSMLVQQMLGSPQRRGGGEKGGGRPSIALDDMTVQALAAAKKRNSNYTRIDYEYDDCDEGAGVGGDLEMGRREIHSFTSSTHLRSVSSRDSTALFDKAEDGGKAGKRQGHDSVSIVQEPRKVRLGVVTKVVGGSRSSGAWPMIEEHGPPPPGISVKRQVIVTRLDSNE